jgi:hypothetical protein
MEPEEQRFAQFIADLALDPARLSHYQEDPEAAMEAAGLDDEEKAVLRTGNFQIICDYLGESGPRPVTYVQGGPGSGPGTDEPGG